MMFFDVFDGVGAKVLYKPVLGIKYICLSVLKSFVSLLVVVQ